MTCINKEDEQMKKFILSYFKNNDINISVDQFHSYIKAKLQKGTSKTDLAKDLENIMPLHHEQFASTLIDQFKIPEKKSIIQLPPENKQFIRIPLSKIHNIAEIDKSSYENLKPKKSHLTTNQTKKYVESHNSLHKSSRPINDYSSSDDDYSDSDTKKPSKPKKLHRIEIKKYDDSSQSSQDQSSSSQSDYDFDSDTPRPMKDSFKSENHPLKTDKKFRAFKKNVKEENESPPSEIRFHHKHHHLHNHSENALNDSHSHHHHHHRSIHHQQNDDSNLYSSDEDEKHYSDDMDHNFGKGQKRRRDQFQMHNRNDRSMNQMKQNSRKKNQKHQLKPQSHMAFRKPRFIVAICGLEPNLNNPYSILKELPGSLNIRGIQIFKEEKFALVEYGSIESACRTVFSNHPLFGNSFIEAIFASDVDPTVVEQIKHRLNRQNEEKADFTINISSDSDSSTEYNSESQTETDDNQNSTESKESDIVFETAID